MMLRSSAAAKSFLTRSRHTQNQVMHLFLRPVSIHPARGFALFNAKIGTEEAGGQQQRSQEEIIRNIDTYRNNIRSKT